MLYAFFWKSFIGITNYERDKKKNGVLQLEALSCKAAEVAGIFSCLQVWGDSVPPTFLDVTL